MIEVKSLYESSSEHLVKETIHSLKQWRFTIIKNGKKEYYHGSLWYILSLCDKDTGLKKYHPDQIVKKESLEC